MKKTLIASILAFGMVLSVQAKDIVETAVSAGSFKTLVTALGAAGLVDTLKGKGPFTVFAPTNQAFRDAGFASTDGINAADPNVLAAILTYHVLAGRVFSSNLTEGAQPTTLAGGTVTISLVNGATVKGSGNASTSNIIGTNLMGSNGVIHLIDRVLLKQ